MPRLLGEAYVSISIGTIGLTNISGEVGKGIKLGQFLCGQGFKDWEHAFMLGPNGSILEAEPGGARLGHVSQYSNIYWCHQIAAEFEPKLLSIWDQGVQKYGPGAGYKSHTGGVPYSFLDYDAIAAHRLHLPAPKNYIASTGHMICSQLVDQMYTDKGAHMFTDNRWPGFVMPMSLFNLDQALLSQKLSGR